tara:strand:- start:993 stop:1811 length:819 start_codon:yes stop_codon:yes gene_type:complete
MRQISIKRSLNIRGNLFEYNKPLIMGILNMTPDSFYDGGKFNSNDLSLERLDNMVDEGASIIDIGGCSTRPGSESISLEDEWDRIKFIIKESVKRYPKKLISVDTYRSEIASRALSEGVHLINDVSGGSFDSNMFNVISENKIPYVLMHLRGTPKDMMSKTDYDDLIIDIMSYFKKKIDKLNSLGVNDIILDPGFGFAKDFDQNFEILDNLSVFSVFNLPILVGLSRKSFIRNKYGVENSLEGTLEMNKLALEKGAEIIRVHDIKEHRNLIA